MEDANICIISLVIIVFVIFIIRIISLSMRNIILLRQLKHEEARQHAQVNSQGNDANNGNGLTPTSYPSNTEKTMQSADCPPTYENAMANCIDAEQQSREMEQSVINGGGMTVAASTTTIETCISEIDLRTTESATNETIININNVIAKPTQQ